MSDLTKISRQAPPGDRDNDIFRKVVVEGHSRASIAAQYSLSENSIGRIVRHVERWLAMQSVMANPRLLRTIHLRMLNHQWQQVMEAWYHSQEEQKTTKVSQDPAGKQKSEMTVRGQTGDYRYLDQARRIMAEIRLLAGVTGPPDEETEDLIDVATLTLDERAAELTQCLDTIGQRQRAEEDRGANLGEQRQLTLFGEEPA